MRFLDLMKMFEKALSSKKVNRVQFGLTLVDGIAAGLLISLFFQNRGSVFVGLVLVMVLWAPVSTLLFGEWSERELD